MGYTTHSSNHRFINHHQIRRNIHYEHSRSKTNQHHRLSAKSGLFAREAARRKPVGQISTSGGNGSLVQGERRTQPMRLRYRQGAQAAEFNRQSATPKYR